MIHAHDVEAELWRFVDEGDQPSSNDLWRCIQYTARKKATALPSSFTRDSEMHLVDQHMIDTTDRHLVKAFCEQFRPGATEKDMQKPLFYLTPFITCSKCNSILFIDAANARCFGAPVPESVRLKRGGNETLAVCPGCAMTEDLQVGLISASRGAAAPSRHRRDSCPSDEVVGGLFFEFEAVRTASSEYDAPRRRWPPCAR